MWIRATYLRDSIIARLCQVEGVQRVRYRNGAAIGDDYVDFGLVDNVREDIFTCWWIGRPIPVWHP